MPDRPGPCVHPDVGAYALGLLEAEERHAYERHLITCAHCLRTLEGLAPLIELLGQVDAATLFGQSDAAALFGLNDAATLFGQSGAAALLADAERGWVRRIPPHPPGAVIPLFPRQREPARERRRRPHLRAWNELDDRFRPPPGPARAAREDREAERAREDREAEHTREDHEAEHTRQDREAQRAQQDRGAEERHAQAERRRGPVRRRRKGSGAVVRRLVLVAAAVTVVMMVSLVTIVARSSVTGPGASVAAAPAKAPGTAAAAGTSTTAAAPPATGASPATAPAPPSPPPPGVTPATTGALPARTKEKTKPAPAATRPDTIKSDPGGGAAGERLAGRDPATGAAAEVRLSRTAAGLDVSLSVTALPGPRDCLLRVVTADGAARTALRWRMAAGQDAFTGLGSTTVERAAIDRLEVVDAGGAVLVTISSR
ncbi:hypothetical protein RB614_30005 [Phytohabitans sp. ZYX-F-186]|uniref:Zinc-finger domain-containing protein n=1 Tax=Phytohabitans maris TaxID=3071409 RepID=A0ABU0ZP09_9ACTN|nr:hypothetical protein [Phytohabitans sp. ZYX-F-186]MDQ7908774.1 hypothetical protein [Phytohabitans sp. ZYX-F-186]